MAALIIVWLRMSAIVNEGIEMVIRVRMRENESFPHGCDLSARHGKRAAGQNVLESVRYISRK